MKMLILIAAPAVLATGLFGFRSTWQRFQVGVDEIRGVVNENTSSETLFNLAAKELQADQARISRCESTLAKYQREAVDTAERVANLEAMAKEGRSRLTTLRPALAGENGGVFVCHGTRYSPCEVAEEARNLVAAVTRCEKEAALRSGNLKTLHQAVASGKTSLTEARSDLAKVEARLAELALKLETEDVRKDTLAAARAINDSLKTKSTSGLSATLDTIEKRYAEVKQENDSVTGPAPIVAWENASATASGSGSVVADVDALLATTDKK